MASNPPPKRRVPGGARLKVLGQSQSSRFKRPGSDATRNRSVHRGDDSLTCLTDERCPVTSGTVQAPSAGFEPATPGLGNLLCIWGSRHPKTPINIGFSRSLGLARSGAQFYKQLIRRELTAVCSCVLLFEESRASGRLIDSSSPHGTRHCSRPAGAGVATAR